MNTDKVIDYLTLLAVSLLVSPAIFMVLWNSVLTTVTTVGTISFLQALGLVLMLRFALPSKMKLEA